MIHQHRTNGLELLYCLPRGEQIHPTPLLFVHGAFAGAWIWADHYLPWFAERGYAAYALSLRGHGESDQRHTISWHSIACYVEDVAHVVDWLSEEPVLIGHSMGGFVAQKYLEHHSAAALVLLCSAPPQGLMAAQFHLLLEKPALFAEINQLMSGRMASVEAVRDALFAQPVDETVLREFLKRTQTESHRAIWDMTIFNLPSLAHMQRPPMLVLGAEKDVLMPPFVVQSTAQTYGQHAHIFRHMGHAVTHEQDWEKVTTYIEEWLAKQKLS